MQLPEPGTREFNKLGPEARTLARYQNNYTPLVRENTKTNNQTNMERFAK